LASGHQQLFIPKGSSQPGLTSFIAAFMARLREGASTNQIKRDLRKEIYSSSDFTAATVIKCKHIEKEGCCVFDVTDKAKFLPQQIKYEKSSSEPIKCHCCAAPPISTELPKSSMAGDALEEPSQQSTPRVQSREEAREELSGLFDGEFEKFLASAESYPKCIDGSCPEPTPIYKAVKTQYATRSSPCGGGGDAFNVTRVRAFGSRSSDDEYEEYEAVAIIDTGANRNHFGDRRGFVNR
jgi:hypothetical protein